MSQFITIVTETSEVVGVEDTQALEVIEIGNGLSAYQIAVLHGFVGTEAEWLASLQGGGGGSETTTTLGALINGATAKATPVDADMLPLMDSAASNIVKKLSWANLKATLKTYFDTLYQPLAAVLTATTAAFTTAQETKLAGIATGATANSSDATLLARANHTGTQAQSTIVNLVTDLAAKAADSAVVHDTGDEDIDGIKTFFQPPIIPYEEYDAGAWNSNMQPPTKSAIRDKIEVILTDLAAKAADSAVVHNTGAETVAGVKTFSSSPVVPAPTTDLQAATKKYVDDAVTAGGGYTDESAQDAAAALFTPDDGDIDYTYNDATPSITSTIKAAAVSLAKMASVATGTIFYRKTAGTGAPEVQTLATLKTDLGLTGTNSGDQTSIVGISGTKSQFDTACSDGNFLYESHLDTDITLAADSDAKIATQKAIKAYVDAMASGLDPKASVRVATTANITLSGTQTIDGVSVIAGNRVLVKDQSTASQNGIYVCASGAWSRSTDADASAEVTSGLYCYVSEGTTNASSGWVLSTADPITLGSTSLTFTQFSGAGQITAGSALTKTGNVLDVAVDGSTVEVSADAIRVKDAGITLAKMANMATASLIGRNTAGTGVPEVLSAATVKTLLALVKGDVGLGNVDNTSNATERAATATLENKRIKPRTGTVTSSTTPTINTDNVDFYSITAQTADITSFTTNLSGTPVENQKLWIAITGTAARGITWGSSFEASTVALPTTTVTTNRLDVGFVWNTVTSKWRCIAVA